MKNKFEEKWEAFRAEIVRRGGNGDAVTAAMQEHYELYGEELYLWLASLYDKDIGGWYYSISGRDNEPFRPDIESTQQATNLMLGSGLIDDTQDLPERMREQIIAFLKSLIDPDDGYIYHPQWGKEINDSRRGRDMSWAQCLSRQYRFSYPYPTALERLKARRDGEDMPSGSGEEVPHLKSRSAFLEYLEKCNWVTDAYYSGNLVAAQKPQIVAAGLVDTAIDFLNSKQDKASGLWGVQRGYMAINALLKISAFYTETGSVFPNAEGAVSSAIECLTCDEVCGTTCYQYNAWSSINHLRNNLKDLGGEEGKRSVERIDSILIATAEDTIRATTKKTATFKRQDGGFSYLPHCSTGFSQRMPVSIHQTVESDVNASVLASTGITRNVFSALDLEQVKVPFYDLSDRERYFKALKY